MDVANLSRLLQGMQKSNPGFVEDKMMNLLRMNQEPLIANLEPKDSIVRNFNAQRKQLVTGEMREVKIPDVRSAAPGSGLMKDIKFNRNKDFKPITLAEMLPQRAFPGRVLHATVLTLPVRGTPGTNLVIEDTDGYAILLGVYNQNNYAFASQRDADRAFPLGRKICI
eukprot:Hpha_TRINITY_DN6116_c0_g1::TRINITY_DN6116_c0_g1_i1::g.164995::m.164995